MEAGEAGGRARAPLPSGCLPGALRPPPVPALGPPALTLVLPGGSGTRENTGPQAVSDPRGSRSHLTFLVIQWPLATIQGVVWGNHLDTTH